METKKLLTWIPIVAAVLGTLYTGINTIIKLNNTIEQHTLQLREMSTTVSAIDAVSYTHLTLPTNREV